MQENEISKIILDACIKIHSALGPGLFEDVYEKVLCYELTERGLHVECQIPIPVYWKNIKIDLAYRVDMSVESLSSVHFKQIQTYLKLTGKKLGLLINFNEPLLKEGYKRVVNNLTEDRPQ